MSEMQKADELYEIITEDGEWCAGCSTLDEARHYAMVYSQDGPVEIWFVTRRKLSNSDGDEL